MEISKSEKTDSSKTVTELSAPSSHGMLSSECKKKRMQCERLSQQLKKEKEHSKKEEAIREN